MKEGGKKEGATEYFEGREVGREGRKGDFKEGRYKRDERDRILK